MAYGNPGNPGPSGDYFDDAPAESSAPTEEKVGEETAILPKSILAGKEFNVGEEVVLKIVAMHENDVEVAYSTGEEKEKAPTEEPPMETATAPSGDMASMME